MKTETTETKPKFKKILISANWQAINNLDRRKKIKLELLKDLEKEVTKLTGLIKPKNYEEFLLNPEAYTVRMIKENNPINISIKFDKLLYLLEIDLTNLKIIMNKIDDVEFYHKDWKVHTKLDKERYKTYTTSEAENERYNDCMNLIKYFSKVYGEHGNEGEEKALQQLRNIDHFYIEKEMAEDGSYHKKPTVNYVRKGDKYC